MRPYEHKGESKKTYEEMGEKEYVYQSKIKVARMCDRSRAGDAHLAIRWLTTRRMVHTTHDDDAI